MMVDMETDEWRENRTGLNQKKLENRGKQRVKLLQRHDEMIQLEVLHSRHNFTSCIQNIQ